MSKKLNLIKVFIQNFRSIKETYVNNIGDITVFVGANESGKSNILKALAWFGSPDPLNKADIPVGYLCIKNKEYTKKPIVEAYFEIVDRDLLKEIISEISKNLKNINNNKNNKITDIVKNLNDVIDDIKYLKIEKYANGTFRLYIIYNYQLINLTEYLYPDVSKIYDNISKEFDTLCNKIIREILQKEYNINNERDVRAIVNYIKKSDTFIGYCNEILFTIIKELNSLKKPNDISKIDIHKIIDDIIENIPYEEYVSYSYRWHSYRIRLQTMFKKVLNELEPKLILDIKNYLFIYLSILKFVYLSEEMDLNDEIVISNNSLKETLKDKKYEIAKRLFKVMNIDLNEFDKMSLEEKSLILERESERFSHKILRKYWKDNIGLDIKMLGDKIVFRIIEYDYRNRIIYDKITPPSARSKGFRWFLSYIITLEYLKTIKNEDNKDIILLLDDPAVYLHPDAQKNFLKKLEELSDDIKILYNTHLISLFNEEELDRVLLVYLDKKNRTKIKKPWNSYDEKDIIYPIRRALGIDKILFKEDINKILFVEGISDKFIFEGLKKAELFNILNDWYIHPLYGGLYLDNKKIVKKVRLYSCLSNFNNIKYYFILDSDLKNNFNENQKIYKKLIFLGNENQELEDLIDRDFYLDCVLETYEKSYLHDIEKVKKIKDIVEKLKNSNDSKIIEKLKKEFESNNIGIFSKVNVAITIKRKLYNNPNLADKFEEIGKYIQNIMKRD